jgi:DNA-binding transcriptional LysR family regulator
MSLSEYRESSHIRVQVLGSVKDPIDVGLAKRGVVRNVVLTVPHFSLVPWVVLRTGYVATLSARLAEVYASCLQLEVRTPPLALSPRPVQLIWHQRTDGDPAARFFRDLVVDAARPLARA